LWNVCFEMRCLQRSKRKLKGVASFLGAFYLVLVDTVAVVDAFYPVLIETAVVVAFG